MACETPCVAVNGSDTALRFIKNRAFHESLLGPSLFSTFFKDLEEFTVDTVLSGMEMTQN